MSRHPGYDYSPAWMPDGTLTWVSDRDGKLAGSNRMGYFSGDFFACDPGNNTLEFTLASVALTSLGTACFKRWL